MTTERFRLLAGIVAAHPGRKIVGRTRLQKTVRLLQRVGFPTDYDYMLYFYGPYSEGVQAELGLIEQLGLVKQTQEVTQDGREYYIIEADQGADSPEVSAEVAGYLKPIDRLVPEDSVILELAATYDAFRDLGMNHDDAMQALRRKKGSKCDGHNVEKAIKLLEDLGLPVA